MPDLPLFQAIHFSMFMLILSTQRVVAQPTGSETTSAKPTEPRVTANDSEESVTPVPMERDMRTTIESDTLVRGSFPSVTPEGASSTSTGSDMTNVTAQATTDLDTIPTDNTTDINLINVTTVATTETNTGITVIPTDASTSVCTCDLTPGLGDIGCCCDTIDCGIDDLGSVFAGCKVEGSPGVCIENWLMFRGNVDPSLITINDTFFCVQNGEDQLKDPQTFPVVPPLPRIQSSFSFSQQDATTPSTTSTAFYRVDDSILTIFKSSSLLSVLRQPSPGTASSSCLDRNPARFLRSGSLSCSRSVTDLSCQGDPSLNARSYFNGISLLKAPVPQNVSIPNFMIPVLPSTSTKWSEPSLQNDSCLNVVSKVEFTVGYTSGGELTTASVNVILVNTALNTVVLQDHAVHYVLASSSPTPGPSNAVGLPSDAPVIGRFGNDIFPLTVQGPAQGGECLPDARTPVLLTHNYFTGCSFSSSSDNCYELQSQLFGILQGAAVPELVAMNSGTQPNWTRVIVQNCSLTPSNNSCESGCVVPLTLSVQLLWARQGLLSLPQNQILGAKFIFRCQTVKCRPSSLTVKTEVTFSDTTAYPEPPRGKPQPQWKFPFGFFSRGADDQDAGL